MSGTVKAARSGAKSPRFPAGNQIVPKGKQISPVMQKMRDLLPAQKAAWQLHCMTRQPLSICQKLLSGHRDPNVSMMQALLAADDLRVAMDALFAFIGKDAPLAALISDQHEMLGLQARLDELKAKRRK